MKEISRRIAFGVSTFVVATTPLGSQAARGTGSAAFAGHVVAASDSQPVRNAEIRLLPIDSSRTRGVATPMVFVDSAHARLTIADSTGAFAVRELAAGSYLFQVRRIGFAPVEGSVTVDSTVLRVRIPLQRTSQLLAAMTIHESAVDANTKYLDRVGYTVRSRGAFISAVGTHALFDKHPDWWNIRDYLRTQDVRDAFVVIDGFPVDLDNVGYYPLDQVLAVEIYRGILPMDVEPMMGFAREPTVGGDKSHMLRGKPVVVIWTIR